MIPHQPDPPSKWANHPWLSTDGRIKATVYQELAGWWDAAFAEAEAAYVTPDAEAVRVLEQAKANRVIASALKASDAAFLKALGIHAD